MADQINIPYPYPNYGNDLLAKEIVNGTYMASINMMIRNSKTGEERYVYVPDSPDVIEDLKTGNKPDATNINAIDDNPIVYDRNKSLEDAVLPIKKDIGDPIPLIVSTAMCPQDISYIGSIDIPTVSYSTYMKTVSRYDDGINKFLVTFEKTDDGSSSTNTTGDIYTFYKYIGTSKTKLFDVNVDDNGTPKFIYSIGKRNFFYSGNSVYEYSKDGLLKLLDVTINELVPFMLMDNGRIYIVGMHGSIHLQDVDNGNVITSDFSASRNTTGNRSSAYDLNYFTTSDAVYYVKNGVIYKKNSKDYFGATAKIRFDFLQSALTSKLFHYNEQHNIHKYPFARVPEYAVEYLGDSKEAFFTVSRSKEIFYTKDYVNYRSTGVSADGIPLLFNAHFLIANFENYIYIIGKNKMEIFKINKWDYQIPRSDLGELFAKHDMINRGINNIGD